jgi:hypothetical protein
MGLLGGSFGCPIRPWGGFCEGIRKAVIRRKKPKIEMGYPMKIPTRMSNRANARRREFVSSREASGSTEY